MARPRFLLVTGFRIGTEVTRGAVGFGDFDGPASADGSWVGWRLVGSNNRELARSAQVWATTGACLTALSMLRQRLGEASALVAIDHTRGHWAWRLELSDGRRLAVASRGYQRRREAQYAMEQFLGAARAADARIEDLIRPQVASQPTIRLVPPLFDESDVAPGAVSS